MYTCVYIEGHTLWDKLVVDGAAEMTLQVKIRF